MDEKEMAKHIRVLSRIIEKLNETMERSYREFYNINRHISLLQHKVERLERLRNE